MDGIQKCFLNHDITRDPEGFLENRTELDLESAPGPDGKPQTQKERRREEEKNSAVAGGMQTR